MTTPPAASHDEIRSNLARIALTVSTLPLATVAFVGCVFFVGGVGGHDLAWVVGGAIMVVAARYIFKAVRHSLQKWAGHPVTIWN